MDEPRKTHHDRSVSQSSLSFVTIFPLEIRLQIYEKALRDKRLSKPNQDVWDTAPGLLRTCHQIYDEAKPVFYRVNDFAFLLYTPRPAFRPSPIFTKAIATIETSPNLQLVKRIILYARPDGWRLQTGTVAARRCRLQVAYLSRALQNIPGLCLFVRFGQDFFPSGAGLAFYRHGVLEPLRLVEVVEGFNTSCISYIQRVLSLANDHAGDINATSAYDKFLRLQKYARSFERDPERKKLVGEPSGRPKSREEALYQSLPINQMLNLARNQAILEHHLPFKAQRSIILAQLEARYQKIRKARALLLGKGQRISSRRKPGRIRRLFYYFFRSLKWANGIRAFCAIETFAKSFRYNVTDRVRQQYILESLPPHNDVYNTLGREQSLIELGKATKPEDQPIDKRWPKGASCYSWTRCEPPFKAALKDMLSQFEEIRCLRGQVLASYEANEAHDIVGDSDTDSEINDLDDLDNVNATDDILDEDNIDGPNGFNSHDDSSEDEGINIGDYDNSIDDQSHVNIADYDEEYDAHDRRFHHEYDLPRLD